MKLDSETNDEQSIASRVFGFSVSDGSEIARNGKDNVTKESETS